MGLAGYIVRRALYSILLVVLSVLLVFFLTHFLSPNPAAVWAGPHAAQSVVQAIVKEYHFNDPLYVQAYYFVTGALTFNFGISPYFKQPVASLIATYFPRTLELTFVAMAISILLGVFTGAFAAAHRNKKGDYSVRLFYLIGWCAPPFLISLILQLIFAYKLNYFPTSLLANPALTTPPFVTGFPLIDGLLAGDWPYVESHLIHMALPVLALTFISFGLITRIMRSSMLESLKADYVRTAVMKGVGTRRAIYIHALKNSLIPVITVIALTFAYLIAGAVVVEYVFGYEGMGYLITTALYNYDYPTLVGCTMVITISVVAINLVADVMYALVDPRVRLGD
ncbi:MAG TPA: ABC transporter permease [Nitrososphaerales archaeon]|nr:ABC transporter permease [Nitrososphaerales archaeon]